MTTRGARELQRVHPWDLGGSVLPVGIFFGELENCDHRIVEGQSFGSLTARGLKCHLTGGEEVSRRLPWASLRVFGLFPSEE